MLPARRTVLVTGSNRGIGLALVKQLLAKGDTVVASCRAGPSDTALSALAAAHRDELHIVAMDVSDERSIESAFESVKSCVGHLDAVVNNAGVANEGHPVESSLTAQKTDLMRCFEVNCCGPILVTQRALPLLRGVSVEEGQQPPKVLFVSSNMGSIGSWVEKGGGKGRTSYAASKAALNMAVKSMVAEVPDVALVLLHPGWVATDMGSAGGRNAPVTADESASKLLDYLDRIRLEDTGKFYDAITEEELPW